MPLLTTTDPTTKSGHKSLPVRKHLESVQLITDPSMSPDTDYVRVFKDFRKPRVATLLLGHYWNSVPLPFEVLYTRGTGYLGNG